MPLGRPKNQLPDKNASLALKATARVPCNSFVHMELRVSRCSGVFWRQAALIAASNIPAVQLADLRARGSQLGGIADKSVGEVSAS